MEERLAIVVFSLGGPDSPAAVRPFLFNLFNDRYIIPLAQPLRWLIARTISGLRAKKSRGYYARLGGRSVLLPETEAQARALESAAAGAAKNVRTFVYMRYWHPMAREVVTQLKGYAPTRIVVVPMYPQ
jgi:ferrochelatase